MTATRSTYLIEQLAEMPVFLEKGFLGLPREQFVRVPVDDKSSLVEHLWHIRDCESEFYVPRIEQTLDHDQPPLWPMPDIGCWYVERAYQQRDGDQAIREFTAIRQQLIERLRALTPDQFERVSLRQNGSTFSIYDMIEHIADHDRDHRIRMAGILRSSLLV
jgi:uncharacterized damage-inducible protein DinB